MPVFVSRGIMKGAHSGAFLSLIIMFASVILLPAELERQFGKIIKLRRAFIETVHILFDA